LLTVYAFLAAPAFALSKGTQGTDPNAKSPAGVIYSIPLDSSRQDAAPHKTVAAGGIGGGGGGSRSGSSGSVRVTGSPRGGSNGSAGVGSNGSASARTNPSGAAGSDGTAGARSNGGSAGAATIGSSPSKSGAGGASSALLGPRATSSGATVSGGPILIPGGEPGSLIHSANGFGASSKVPGLGSPASGGLTSVHGSGSVPLVAYLLAGFVLLVGGFVGVRAWR
jgi:hypothetical protein